MYSLSMSLSQHLDLLTADSKRCLVDSTQIQQIVKPFELPMEYLSLDLSLVGKKKIKPEKKKLKQIKLPKSYFYHKNIHHQLNSKTEYLYSCPGYELRIIGKEINNPPLHRIENLISFLNIPSTIKITWWPTSNKKKFINKVLGPEDVNSGSTNLETINIWRQEEFNKVMTHEIVHFSRNHFFKWNNNVDDYLRQRFKIQGKVVSTEAYTEWLAILLHCKFISQKLDPSLLNTLVYNEYLFSLVQCGRIINYLVQGLDNLGKTNWRQETDVFSYFIVKTALLAETQYWFQKYPDRWNFCCDSQEYLDWIQLALRPEGKFFSDLTKVCQQDINKNWTLRMSCIELISE